MLIVCSKCQGEGTVSRVHEKVYLRTALCDTCGGSGKVVEGAKTPEPRNGYVADSPEPVVLNDEPFIFGRVLNVAPVQSLSTADGLMYTFTVVCK